MKKAIDRIVKMYRLSEVPRETCVKESENWINQYEIDVTFSPHRELFYNAINKEYN